MRVIYKNFVFSISFEIFFYFLLLNPIILLCTKLAICIEDIYKRYNFKKEGLF